MLNNKIKVLIVARWPGGGIRTFLRYVYQHFESEFFQFTILGPDDPEIDILKDDLKGLDVEIKKLSERPSTYEIFKAIFRLVACNKYDLIHSQGFTSGICAALPAFITRCPHILTLHDTLSEKQFKGCAGIIKKIGMSIAFQLIQTIHSVSHDAQDNLLHFFPFLARISEKCVVIRNGIEVERFIDVERRDLRTELSLGNDTYLIGYLGRFMSLKGFVYLVDAIEELSQNENLPKHPLVIAFGGGGFIREEMASISKRGLEQYFQFLPFTPNVAEAIKSLDVVVMPSLSEACPLLAMETLVVGTPLIATNCIGLREVIRDTPAFVVPPKNGKAIADGIESFMNDDRSEIFRMFSKEAVNLFDVKHQVIKIRQLIQTMVNR